MKKKKTKHSFEVSFCIVVKRQICKSTDTEPHGFLVSGQIDTLQTLHNTVWAHSQCGLVVLQYFFTSFKSSMLALNMINHLH